MTQSVVGFSQKNNGLGVGRKDEDVFSEEKKEEGIMIMIMMRSKRVLMMTRYWEGYEGGCC